MQAAKTEVDYLIVDSAEAEKVINERISGITETTSLLEKINNAYQLVNSPDAVRAFSKINSYLTLWEYLQNFREGDAFKIPVDIGVSALKAKFAMWRPRAAVWVEISARAIDKLAPILIEANDEYISRRHAFEEQLLANLSPLDQAIMMSDSLADDIMFANGQLRFIHLLAHTWCDLSDIVYENFLPEPLKSFTHDIKRIVNNIGTGLVRLDHERMEKWRSLREGHSEVAQFLLDDDLDPLAPFTFTGARMLLWPFGEPTLRYEVTPETPKEPINNPDLNSIDSRFSARGGLSASAILSNVTMPANLEDKPANAGAGVAEAPSSPVDTKASQEARITASGSVSATESASSSTEATEAPAEASSDHVDEIEFVRALDSSYQSRHPDKVPKEFFGGIRPDIRAIPDGIHAGISSSNNFTGMNVNIGVQFVGIDGLITELGNRFFAAAHVKSGKKVICGDTYTYELHWKRWHIYTLELEVKNTRTGESKTGQIHLVKRDLGHRKNEPRIAEGFEEVFGKIINKTAKNDQEAMLTAYNKAVDSKDFLKANQLAEAYVDKYKSAFNLSQLTENLKNNLDGNIHQFISAADEATLKQMRTNAGYSSYLADINLMLDDFALKRIETYIAEKNFAAAEAECALLTHPENINNTKEYLDFHVKNFLNTSSEAALKALNTEEPVYARQLSHIQSRLDNFMLERIIENMRAGNYDEAQEEAKNLHNSETKQKCQEAIQGGQVSFLFSAAHALLKNAKTSDDLNKVASGLEKLLDIDPTHQEAIKDFIDCKLSQGKYEEVIDFIDLKILSGQPDDPFGKRMRAIADLRNGNTEGGRNALEALLITDPTNQEIRAELALSYGEEVRLIRNEYVRGSQAIEAASDRAVRTFASDAKTKLQAAIDKDAAFLAKVKNPQTKQKLHEQNLLGSEKDKKKAPAATFEEAVEKSLAYKEKLHSAMDSKTNRFWAQSGQMAADGIFFAADYIVDYFQEDPSGRLKTKEGLKHAKTLISNVLQLYIHYCSCDIDNIMHEGTESSFKSYLSYARYGFLSMQVLRNLSTYLDRFLAEDHKKSKDEVVKFVDEYILPIAQLILSLGYLFAAPENIIAGALSFAPEIALRIPEVRKFLLNPDPKESYAFTRFAIGNILKKLSENNAVNSVAYTAGYFAGYSEPINAWFEWMQPYAAAMAGQLPLATEVGNCLEELAPYLNGVVEFIEPFATPLQELVKYVGGYYMVLKLGQVAYTSYAVLSSSEYEWDLYRNKYYFMRGINLAQEGKHDEAMENFAKVARGLDCKASLTTEERELYISALLKQHTLAQDFLVKKIPGDGNCLFSAIAFYVNRTPSILRAEAMDYIQAHSDEMRAFIVGDFDRYVQAMRVEGKWDDINFGEPQIRALEKLLERPIYVGNSARTPDYTLTGRPIFLIYNGKDHFDALVVPGTEEFARSYKDFIEEYEGEYTAAEAVNTALREQCNSALAHAPELKARIEQAQTRYSESTSTPALTAIVTLAAAKTDLANVEAQNALLFARIKLLQSQKTSPAPAASH